MAVNKVFHCRDIQLTESSSSSSARAGGTEEGSLAACGDRD